MESFLSILPISTLETSITSSCESNIFPITAIKASQSLTALSVYVPCSYLDEYTFMELQKENRELKSTNQQFLRIINNLKNQIKDWMKRYNVLECKYTEEQNAQIHVIKEINDQNQEIKKLKLKVQNILADTTYNSAICRNRTKTYCSGDGIKTKIRIFERAAAQQKSIKRKKRKQSTASSLNTESILSEHTGGSEFSAASIVSALSIMGYHGMKTPSVPLNLKSSYSNPLPHHIGTYDYAVSDSASEAESISSDQIRTFHADGRKKRKCKGGKSYRTDFKVIRDKNVENMNIRRAQNTEGDTCSNSSTYSVNVKQMTKIFTASTEESDTRCRRSKRKKKRKRSFYKK